MKHRGASIIFSDTDGRVLLLLRDDLPHIPYPNMWDLPGGHIEPDETPLECIRREMMEELGVDIGTPGLAAIYAFRDRYEYVFTARATFTISDIDLREGQMLRWFTKQQAAETELAYGFNRVLSDYFGKKAGR